MKKWVNGELKEIILQTLQKPKIVDRFLNTKDIQRICFDKGIPEEKQAKMLWSLFVLEVWYKKYQEAWHKIQAFVYFLDRFLSYGAFL